MDEFYSEMQDVLEDLSPNNPESTNITGDCMSKKNKPKTSKKNNNFLLLSAKIDPIPFQQLKFDPEFHSSLVNHTICNALTKRCYDLSFAHVCND